MGLVLGRAGRREAADPGSGAPAIQTERLHKAYRGEPAVRSIDLSVDPGTVLGLLGPNGAGKTTLIRMLSTVLPQDAGWYSVAGVPWTAPERLRRRIGVLPESAGYPRAQTAEEWLVFHARLFGASRGDARSTAQRLLGEVGLSDRRRSMISGLSRGMRQRLGIARALVNDPRVVFLDEPTLGLDPLGQRQILQLVTDIARERGVTVLLSTHVLSEVEEVCDRVVILNRGHVVADGTVADVVRRAAAPRQAVVQVPPALRDRALEVLAEHGTPATRAPSGHLGDVELRLPATEAPDRSSAAALRCLLDAQLPVLGFSLEGGRLSDAFLAVTQEERR